MIRIKPHDSYKEPPVRIEAIWDVGLNNLHFWTTTSAYHLYPFFHFSNPASGINFKHPLQDFN